MHHHLVKEDQTIPHYIIPKSLRVLNILEHRVYEFHQTNDSKHEELYQRLCPNKENVIC